MILKPRRHIYVVANVKIKLFTNEAKSPKITSEPPCRGHKPRKEQSKERKRGKMSKSSMKS